MGKGKSCTPEQRSAIFELYKAGKCYREIAEQLRCSKKMVFNALQHINKYDTIFNVPRRNRPRKTSEYTDRMIRRISKCNPKKTSTDIQRDIQEKLNIKISKRTISRRLVEGGLHGRAARKKPLLRRIQRKRRVDFAKSHWSWTTNQWKYLLWSDETKINRLGPDGRRYVRRPINQEFNPRYISPVVKHGGGSIMVWGCFSWNGVGPIYKIDGILNKEKYVAILNDVMLPWAEENLPVIWQFQQDNDPKHTAKLTKKFFEDNSVNVLDWPSSSPDLNPIEHLWGDVKKAVSLKNITNMESLFEEVKLAWYAIPVERCRHLIASMRSRCEAVMKQKGFATRY